MSHLKNWQTRKDQKFNHTVYVGLLNSCRFQSNAWQRPRWRLKLAEDLIGGGIPEPTEYSRWFDS
ncbi:MAG: hypothetical protein DME53_00360 [Verrucomicrobia bacterium]|nr:MAG: hypothetical protein DME53_00360 [Verrucomicrobiota bacterium]